MQELMRIEELHIRLTESDPGVARMICEEAIFFVEKGLGHHEATRDIDNLQLKIQVAEQATTTQIARSIADAFLEGLFE